MSHFSRCALGVAFIFAGLSGCATSSESAGAQQLTVNVGRYSIGPNGVERPRVGVPAFTNSVSGTEMQLNNVAADQATTLLVNTGRFEVIERAQLDQLQKEQGLQDVVHKDEATPSGQVHGVQYLLVGKVTNFRVKAEKAKRGFGLGNLRLPGAGALGAFDFKKASSKIVAEVGIDLRLVDAKSGSIFTAKSKDYTRTDSIGAFGIEILGVGADADADLKIDDDNKGMVLRLAIDDCLRDMLPEIDRQLLAKHKTGS